jgi:predicted nucleotidyltransferase
MTREEIIATIRSNEPAIRAEGVRKLWLFGSRARGDHRPDSDIDVLLDVLADAPFTLHNLVGVQHIIEDATGLAAQASMKDSLKPRVAERIADDLIEVF